MAYLIITRRKITGSITINVSSRPNIFCIVNINSYRPAYINTKNAIAFAAIKIKIYYDMYYRPIFFEVKNLINLQLYKNYNISSIKYRKID